MKRNDQILGGLGQDQLVVRILGFGTMNNSRPLYDYIVGTITSKTKKTFIDLSECDSMDSTFMGTLLVLHDELKECGGELHISNCSSYVKDKLSELGICEVLSLLPSTPTMELEWVDIVKADQDNDKRMELVVEAHEQLVEKNEENKGRFATFLSSMRTGKLNDKNKNKKDPES